MDNRGLRTDNTRCRCGLPAEDDERRCAQCITEAGLDALEREAEDWYARCAA